MAKFVLFWYSLLLLMRVLQQKMRFMPNFYALVSIQRMVVLITQMDGMIFLMPLMEMC